MLKLGIAGNVKLAALRDSLQIQFAGQFVIESEVPNVNIRIDGRRFRSARAFEDKVGASLHRKPVGLDPPHLSEVEIITREVEMERASGRFVGGAPGDD